MNYEKLYKEALERAKKVIEYYNEHHRCDEASIEDLECVFPELKESEDERIRKKLIEAVKGDMVVGGTKDKQRAIAWLEKQGEQDMIPLDKVIKFLDDQLVNDKDEVTGEPFINFQNYGAFKESFISYFKRKMLEKQGSEG